MVAPVELTVAPAGGGGRSDVTTAPEAASRRCKARLVALDIDTGDGCFLDERISKSDGVLVYPCDGDGAVEAVFGEHRFQGEANGGRVTLSLTTELDWDEDHCRWQSQQKISGEIGMHELAWSYVDRPIKGEQCSGSCTARAAIEIDPDVELRPRSDPNDGDDEDDGD